MTQRIQVHIATIAVAWFLWSIFPAAPLRAEDTIEKAGVVTGVTAGNMWFIPLKAISVSMGAISGALSFVLTGGDDGSDEASLARHPSRALCHHAGGGKEGHRRAARIEH